MSNLILDTSDDGQTHLYPRIEDNIMWQSQFGQQEKRTKREKTSKPVNE